MSLLTVAFRRVGVAVACRASAAQHLRAIARSLGITESAHTALLQAARVLGGAHALSEGLSLGPGSEDGHVHVPSRAAPLGPDTVVLVLATRVGVHQQSEVGAMVHKPRHNGAEVMHRYEHAYQIKYISCTTIRIMAQKCVIYAQYRLLTPLSHRERAQSLVRDVVIVDHADAAIVYAISST